MYLIGQLPKLRITESQKLKMNNSSPFQARVIGLCHIKFEIKFLSNSPFKEFYCRSILVQILSYEKTKKTIEGRGLKITINLLYKVSLVSR